VESVKTALQPCANPNCREQFAPSERKKYCSDRCRAFVHGVKQRIGPHAYLWFVDLERRLRRLER
jgi:hypothetical protein